MHTYSTTARCDRWGAAFGARRVTGLTQAEREAIRAGKEIRMAGCPEYQGQTDRRIVAVGRNFFARMP